MSAAGLSLVGRRKNNEDTFRIREDLGLFLVADGMGGYEGGEVASRLVADTLARFFERAAEGTQPLGNMASEQMNVAIRMAHKAVVRRAEGKLQDMGTTLASLWLRGPNAIVAHVGDSRVYRLRDGALERLTVDHSFLQELRASGAVDSQQVTSQLAAMVTRCIAPRANATAELQQISTQAGDRFLLCSDGVTDVLDDETLRGALQASTSATEAVEEVAHLAYSQGSHDNITAVVVRV